MTKVTATDTAKLQTSVAKETREFLRLESLRRHLTMGQLLDEMVGHYTVSETTT